eukprot:6167379-Pleurochrysis_carterae.AAC.2
MRETINTETKRGERIRSSSVMSAPSLWLQHSFSDSGFCIIPFNNSAFKYEHEQNLIALKENIIVGYRDQGQTTKFKAVITNVFSSREIALLHYRCKTSTPTAWPHKKGLATLSELNLGLILYLVDVVNIACLARPRRDLESSVGNYSSVHLWPLVLSNGA